MLEMGFQNDVESIIANVKSPGKESQLAAAKSLSKFGSNWDNDEDDYDEDADESLQALGVKTQRDVQMLLFSATMPGWICKLTNKHMNKPIFLDAVQEGETRLASTIKHLCIRLPRGDRIKTLSAAMEDLILTKGAGGQTIVFTNTKDEADNLVSADCFGQLRSKVIHGDISQSARQTTIKQFKDGQIDVLVATDVAARGLDIAGVDLVVHTGPPNDHDTFVHRSGRTGRAGRNGTSIMLYTYTDEEKRLSTFEKILNFNFEKSHQPGPEEVARASAWYAAKKLEKVNDEAINYFLPHAKSMITSLLNDEKEFEIPHFSLVKNKDELEIDMDVSDYSSDQVEKLMARCLAVLSNKNSIASKSLLTSEVGKTTLLINAVFKNGTTPNNVRDWQRVFSGILRRSFNIDDIKFGKFVMGQVSKSTDYCGVVDIDADLANTLIDQIKEDPSLLPSGIEITRCIKLPHIIEDSFESRINLSGDRYGHRGGSGGYNRGGTAGGK